MIEGSVKAQGLSGWSTRDIRTQTTGNKVKMDRWKIYFQIGQKVQSENKHTKKQANKPLKMLSTLSVESNIEKMCENKKLGNWKLDCEFNGREVMVQIYKSH